MSDRDPRFNALNIAIIAAAILYGLTAYAAFGRTLPDDHGGNLREYRLNAMLSELRGEQIEIRGVCASACGVYLRVACVHPTATLGFHSPANGTEEEIEAARHELARFMPPTIGQWYLDGPAYLTGGDYAVLTGAQAIEMGARGCAWNK